jgi:hypothetical protein
MAGTDEYSGMLIRNMSFINSSFGSMKESNGCGDTVSMKNCSFVDEGEHTLVFHHRLLWKKLFCDLKNLSLTMGKQVIITWRLPK